MLTVDDRWIGGEDGSTRGCSLGTSSTSVLSIAAIQPGQGLEIRESRIEYLKIYLYTNRLEWIAESTTINLILDYVMLVMTASELVRLQVCAVDSVIKKLFNGVDHHVKPSPTIITLLVLF